MNLHLLAAKIMTVGEGELAFPRLNPFVVYSLHKGQS